MKFLEQIYLFNVLIDFLILKEKFSLSDEKLIPSLYFDISFQLALSIMSYEKQPVFINILYNFRIRVLECEKKTSRDLTIDGKMSRMDSVMISSLWKKLSCIELFNLKLIKTLNKLNPKLVLVKLKCYL